MRYNSDFIGLSTILNNILSKYNLTDLRVDEPLYKNWREIVGRELAEYFTPKYQQGGILYLQTIKPASGRELKAKQKKLLQRFITKGDHPQVKEVKFI